MASPYIVRKTAYFSMQAPNRPGQGARILNGLAAHGVNLVAFTGFPTGGRAQVDFMPYNPKKFVEAAHKLGYKVSARKTVFLAGTYVGGISVLEITRSLGTGMSPVSAEPPNAERSTSSSM